VYVNCIYKYGFMLCYITICPELLHDSEITVNQICDISVITNTKYDAPVLQHQTLSCHTMLIFTYSSIPEE